MGSGERWRRGVNGVLSRYSRLGWLLCLALLPGLATGCVFIATLYLQARAEAEEDALHTARAMSQVFDGVADASLARLEALATSPLLANGELAAFHRQAREAGAIGSGAAIVVADADGRQLMNTLVRYGAPLPRTGAFDAVRRAVATDAPAVSDLFQGAVSRQPHVAVVLPLARYGLSRQVLIYGIPATRLDQYFARQHMTGGRRATLLDQLGHVMAHSGGANRGAAAGPAIRAALVGGPEGALAGGASHVAYVRSAATGWTVLASVSDEALREEVYGSLGWAWAAIAAVLAAGIAAAWWLHREAVRGLHGLQQAALQAEQGSTGARAVVAGPREIARLALQFNRMQAANEQSQRALELAASVFRATSEGILIVGADLRIIEANRAFLAMSGYRRDELLGHSPKILQSGRHDAAFYTRMWAALNGAGNWEGQIWDRRRDGSLFAAYLSVSRVDGADGRVSHYISLFTDITEQRLRQDEVEEMAYRDPLTHLPNRRLMQDRLRQAIAASARTNAPLAVCSIDLDGFKQVNDTRGHEAGDEVLVAVAERLRQVVRANDTVARLGGDEFVLVLVDLHRLDEAEEIAARALAAIREPVALTSGGCAGVAASIGIAHCPADARDAVELLRLSDAAMYRAKQGGRNRVVLHGAAECGA